MDAKCGDRPTQVLPPPPPQKSGARVWGGGGNTIKKFPWGIILSPKKMMLQVRHPISFGVCYANDPPKGGVYGARACA